MRRIYVVLAIGLLTLISGMPLAYAEEIELRLVYSDVEFFPYQIGNGREIADPPGIALELITQAAEEIGVKIEFERRPNKRVLIELHKNTADGAFCFSFKEERLKCGAYPMKDGQPESSRRITSVSYYIYKKKDSPLDWDGTQFLNLEGRIGGNSGYSIVDDLRQKGYNMDEAKTTEQNLLKLQSGRIAGYAAQDITTDFHVESGQYGEIVKAPTPLATKDYFLMLSHQFVEEHPDIAEQLWTKIGELRDSVTKEAAPKYQKPGE